MPKMGMDTTEVVVGNWLVQVGDSVRNGAPLVELESEKTTFVVEAETAGQVVAIRQPAGSTAPVGEVLCILAAD